MPERPACPGCGTPLPPGTPGELCPKCLLKLGLEESASTGSGDDPDDSGSPDQPARIGAYRILRVLGKGGMGEVYLAEQERPIRRRVAVKVIKRGMDTGQVIARFESERQALALMDHPNVAKVLDAGDDHGRPYFVMEYVAGIPITEYCDRHRLTTRERLDLFTTVCQAIQHAHQKGIIHRDIKPSNVLVAFQDGQPVPKVIDFGVAKAIRQRLTEKTLFTQHGMLLGTPEYMSPEQAELTGLDVDTRTDIYALGVLLYELLVGALPFDPETLRNAAFDEIRRIIREEDPDKPTTRLNGLGDAGAEVARRRGTDLRSLSRQIEGDLEWITLKALEKDRTRRYAAASEFADDIGRHIRNDPVIAGSPSRTYRLGKFVRKHRKPVVAVASVVLTALAFGSVAIWLGMAARRNASRVLDESILQAAASTADPLVRALLLLDLGDSAASPEATEIARRAVEAPLPVAVFRGHESPVLWGRFTGDGTRFVSTSLDGTARVWNADATGDAIVLPNYPFGPAAISPNGFRVATHTESGLLISNLDEAGESVMLSAPAPTYLDTFLFPEDPLTFFSDDGNWVASIMDQLRVWRTDVDTDPFVPPGSGGSDMAVRMSLFGVGPLISLSPDGSHIAARAARSEVNVWRTDGADPPIRLRSHTSRIMTTRFSPSGRSLVSVDENGGVRIWRPFESVGPVVIEGLQSLVLDARFSPDESTLLTTHGDGNARLSAVDGSGDLVALSGGGFPLHARFSPNGQRILTVTDPDTLGGIPGELVSWGRGPTPVAPSQGAWTPVPTARIYESDGTLVHELRPAFQGRFLDAVYTPNGAFVMTAFDEDRSIRLWRVDVDLEPVLHGHLGAVNSAVFDSTGQRIVTAGEDGTARVWFIDGRDEPVILIHDAPVRSAAFSSDGERVLTVARDGSVRMWSADSEDPPVLLAAGMGVEPYYVPSAAFSPDGTRVLTYSAVQQSRELVLPSRPRAFVSSGPFEPPPPPPAPQVRSSDGTGGPVVLSGHEGDITAASFSSDGNVVVTASYDGTARIWWLDGTREALVLAHETPVLAAAFGSDGSEVATLTEDGSIRLWPVREPGEARLLGSVQLSGSVQTKSLVFGPKRRWLALVGAETGAVYLWEIDGDQEPAVLRGGEGEIGSASFSADGDYLLTAASAGFRFGFVDDTEEIALPGMSGGVRIWSLDDPGVSLILRRFVTFALEDSDVIQILAAAFSPNGDQVVTAHSDGSTRISYLGWPDLIDVLRTNTTSCLTPEERMRYRAETPQAAQDRYTACELAHGRTP